MPRMKVPEKPKILKCMCCGKDVSIDEMYSSENSLYRATGKAPFCKSCVEKIYQNYVDSYRGDGYSNPEKKAMERICMIIGIYFSETIFEAAMNRNGKASENTPTTSLYFKQANLMQYKKKTYDTTIQERISAAINADSEKEEQIGMNVDGDVKRSRVVEKARKFFGNISNDDNDYIFLQEQYDDWTARHECQTKTQEEMFKQICFTQLELNRAMKSKSDTKDLNATFLKQLDAAKLQPKQNKGDALTETQTFGTLIDKWETTRPIPDIDEDLKDVDHIGGYLDVFFKGHLAKMMGMKNGLSRLYKKFMEKYTVNKPNVGTDEDDEATFDAIFGKPTYDD